MLEKIIEQLNKVAMHQQKNTGCSTEEAIEFAAQQHGFVFVHGDGRYGQDDDARIYQNRGIYVNAWLNFDKVAEGEGGFDDQIEWWLEQVEQEEQD